MDSIILILSFYPSPPSSLSLSLSLSIAIYPILSYPISYILVLSYPSAILSYSSAILSSYKTQNWRPIHKKKRGRLSKGKEPSN